MNNTNQDLEHLKLLSIFHYIVGGFTALFACFPIIHLLMGLFLVFAGASGASGAEDAPMAVFGAVFIVVPLIIILMGWALAACIIVAGTNLARQSNYNFCLVVAAVSCVLMPFGTVLGVFTIIVLMRPSVKALFGIASQPPVVPAAPAA